MKIEFEGVTRVLDLEHVKLKHAVAIQAYTGLAVFAWQEALSGLGDLTTADATEVTKAAAPERGAVLKQKLQKTAMYTDPAWITNLAAGYWLMLAQAGEDVPPLDDDFDPDVLGFAVAFLTAMGEEVKSKRPQDKPDPTVPPGRASRPSRRTAAPKKPKTVPGEVLPPPPLTGS